MNEPRALARDYPTLMVLTIFFGLVGFNLISASARPTASSESMIWAAVFGAWVIQPILFGVWVALARGPVITRLPIVIPCLLILFLAAGLISRNFAKIERIDFLSTAAGGIVIFIATTMVFLGVRWFARLRIKPPGSSSNDLTASRIRFDMKYLLAATTIYAVLLAMVFHLKFASARSWPSLGPEIYLYLTAVETATLFALSLPTVMIPLFVLSQKLSGRAILYAMGFWIVVTTSVVAYMIHIQHEQLPDLFESVAMFQSGGAIVGIFVAVPLRSFGFRLAPETLKLPEELGSTQYPCND